VETASDLRDHHDEALTHVIGVFARASVMRKPCLHGVLQEVFPRTYFAKLFEALPGPEKYKAIPSATTYDAACRRSLMVGGERHHLWLAHLLEASTGSLAVERDRSDVFWYGFARRFASPTFIAALSEHFLGKTLSSSVDLSIRFVRETGGVYIAPHLDMSHKLMSMICYLGQSRVPNGLQGTSLYEIGASGVPIVRKSVPFVPNSALVLPRTEESLHGVEPHLAQSDRLTLHFYLQEANKDARGVVRLQ
jgi:hypothetical protein